VLADLPAKEIADALGISAASVYQMKRNLNQAQADRITEAFGAPAPAEKKPAPKEKKSAFVTGDHPAWDIIEKYSAYEIADKCGVSVDTIDGIAESGLRPGLAEAIVAAFPDLSEDRMKEVLREEALRNDGEMPYLAQPGEPVLDEPEPGPLKSWIDPSVKKQADPVMGMLRQLLQVEGAVLVVPLAALAKLRGGVGHD
jgi:hypothetical protein